MKRLISLLVIVAMMLATFAVIVPASAATTKKNVMGGSDAATQFKGEGNVFYFDYHKYIAEKGYTSGETFPTAVDKAGDAGKEAYMLRIGSNNGQGTASVCDGEKATSGFSHNIENTVTIDKKTYAHVFGYSFRKSVTVDSAKFYLPTDTKISTIDVYGAVYNSGVYGKEAAKTYLGSFNVPAATSGAANIIVDAAFEEAMKVDYIFFGVNFGSTVSSSDTYKFYEIELFGLDSGAADFSELKTAYASYKRLSEADYEPDSWAILTDTLKKTDPVNKNALSTADEISVAAKLLNNAIDSLVALGNYKFALSEKISEAKAFVKKDYTSATWSALQEALAEAETAVGGNDDNAIKTAYSKLANAIGALKGRINVMGNSDKDKQWAGEGNVFYFDYHKYTDVKAFPVIGKDQGQEDTYMLRIGENSGSGTASVCDGNKTSGGLSHNIKNTVDLGGKTYGHVFGYSFAESVTVDSAKFYLPTTTKIVAIDVYGAVFDGTNYGKEAAKTYLGSFAVSSGTVSASNIIVDAAFDEAMKVDYIFFALSFDGSMTVNDTYKFYEIEVFGLKDGAADFTSVKKAYTRYLGYTSEGWDPDSWNTLVKAAEEAALVMKNALSSASEISTAATNLNTAINTLQKKKADKTLLEAEINAAKLKLKDEFTPSTWAPFESALNAAEAAFANETIEQSAVDKALSDLKIAAAGLMVKGDMASLKAKIDEAKLVVKEDYQGDVLAWSSFEKQITKAEELLLNENATQGEVEDAINALIDAKAALKPTGPAVVPPETDAPETDAPETNAPETDAPETDAPETNAPETAAPETDAPATDAPETNPPATEPPVTEAPETEAPATEPPATEPPATQAPETQAPATDIPTEMPTESESSTDDGLMVITAKGCASTISLSAIAVVGVIGTAVVIKKRKDD